MKPIGFYLNCDEAICLDHIVDLAEVYGPIFSDSEADSPTHCTQCEALIPHALTNEGHRYVREALAENTGRPEILAMWKEAYT
jgi:hypothetical protein